MRSSYPASFVAGLALLATIACAACGGDGNDADGDTITDDEEQGLDTNMDSDMFPSYLDLDSDADGIQDAVEAGDPDLATPAVDTDGDGSPDFLDLDADDDTVQDSDELTPPDFSVADTDGDGLADHVDTDADGDGIPDAVEAGDPDPATPPVDTDADGVPDARSLDSDGDCIPDRLEAGPDPTAPRFSDGDPLPDYRDLDSDNDGLPDRDEDKNCNGMLDAGESSPTSTDTDGDGTPDLVEVVAGSNPNDPGSTIPAGDFYFVLPYMGPGQNGLLDFSTTVKQADIFFSVDTTGSFGQEIAAIQASITNTIIPGVAAVIPNAAFGVGRVQDFPLAPFGLAGDRPFQLLQPITTITADVVAGLAALAPARGGLDVPEAHFEALYQWATGVGFPAFNYPAFAPPGIGGAGFRPDSLPIIVHITDAIGHAATDYPFASHDQADAIAALRALNARVIGVDSLENQGTPLDPRGQLEQMAVATAATIPPNALNQCLTGVNGATRPAFDLGGSNFTCPVVFDVLPNGNGLGTLIVDAIRQLATLGVLDISTRAVGQLQGLRGEILPAGTTTARFLTAITPVPPPPPNASIVGDVFMNVTPGSTVTFRLDAFNDFVPSTTDDQLFAIDVHVLGDAVTLLDVRRVFVIVPRAPIVIN